MQETKEQKSNVIMILDDDPKFRQLIGSALEAEGYEVWQAKDSNDAFAMLEYAVPTLAIVDYRLPGQDGISWITNLRERNYAFPVILCTGTWVDAKTFTFLRNILNVNMVIQKPVVPELLVHTLHNMLHDTPETRPQAEGTRAPSMEYPQIASTLKAGGTVEQMLAAMDEAIKSESDPEKLERLQDLRKRTAGQQKLAEARRKYIVQLDQSYREFIAKITMVRVTDEAEKYKEAAEEAHKIKGSAGSFGVTELSTVAGRLEELLNAYESGSLMMHELLLSEIDEAIVQGRRVVDRAAREIGEINPHEHRVWTVLVVGQNDRPLIRTLKDIIAKNDGLEIEVATTIAEAQSKCRQLRYDGMIIDVSIDSSDAPFQMAKEVRQIPGYLRMPMGFVGTPMSGDAIYGGASFAANDGGDPGSVTNMLVALTHAAEVQKPRILCIDDDEDVTKFVDATLTDSGFSVKTLNEPIRALEVVNEFGPDAILLDVMMPGISGFDVCRGLKTHEASAGKPVLFLTASYDSTSRQLAYKAGGEDFIAKPVIREELIARLRAYVPLIPDRLGAGGAALLDKSLFMNTVNQFMGMQGAVGTVLLVIVDDIDEIEKQHGAFAPEIISTILARLVSIRFRPQDLRTQIDRDRFSIFLPDTTSTQERELVAAMRREVESLYFPSASGDKFSPKIHIKASPIAGHAVAAQ